MSTEARSTDRVTVEGDRAVTVGATPGARDRFGWDARSFTIRCHSGRVIEGRWAGIPFFPVAEAAGVPPETTHLLVTGRDEYRACVSVLSASDALIGFEREAIRVTGPESDRRTDGTPRLLSEGFDSTEAVREVARIESVAVPAGAEPLAFATTGG